MTPSEFESRYSGGMTRGSCMTLMADMEKLKWNTHHLSPVRPTSEPELERIHRALSYGEQKWSLCESLLKRFPVLGTGSNYPPATVAELERSPLPSEEAARAYIDRAFEIVPEMRTRTSEFSEAVDRFVAARNSCEESKTEGCWQETAREIESLRCRAVAIGGMHQEYDRAMLVLDRNPRGAWEHVLNGARAGARWAESKFT